MLCEIDGCLTCRICPAHDIDSFALTRESLRRPSAIIDTRALQSINSRGFKSPPLHSRGNHQSMARDLVPVRQFNESIRSFRSDVNSLQRRKNFDAETLSLYHSAASQIAATEADRKSQIILDTGTHSRLPARSFLLNHHGVQAFGGAIHSSGKPRRPSAYDSQVIKIGLRAHPKTDFFSHFRRHALEKFCSIDRKYDRKTC